MSITSASLTLRINGFTEFFSYHPKLFSSLQTQPSLLINACPPFSAVKYNMSVSLLGWNATCIITIFFDILSMFFSSTVVHIRIPGPYLNTDTAYALILNILFLRFHFDFKTNFNLLLYSVENVFFISVSLILFISTISWYLYPHSSIYIIVYPFGSTILFSFTTFPLFSTNTPNSIPISSLKKCTFCTAVFFKNNFYKNKSHDFGKKFRKKLATKPNLLSHRTLLLYRYFDFWYCRSLLHYGKF